MSKITITKDSINGVLESQVAGPNYAVPYSMIEDLSQSIVDICNQIVVIDNSINILFDNSGGGDSFDQSYNLLYLSKPQFVENISGGFDLNDDRIEIQWDLPVQYRASNNFNSGTHRTINSNVFSPSLISSDHAPYYPSGYGGNRLSTQATPPSQPHTLDLTVPAYSTGIYNSPSDDPSFNDLNYLPYHQNIGIDFRRKLSGTISDWCTLQPDDIDYKKSSNPQHLWAGTRGFYIRNDSNNAGTSGGDYSPNGNNTTIPGPGGNQGDKIYQLTNSPIFQIQGQSGASFQFRVYLTNNSDEVLTATPHDISFASENPPYWRYSYFPDVSSQFISFGAPGAATPPRNITNGPGLWGALNQPNGTNDLVNPVTSYRTLAIEGQNNNARPYVDPSGSPTANTANANCAADVSMSLAFDQLANFSINTVYSFDLSGEYHYPLEVTNPSNGASNPQRPWGEQYDPSMGNALEKTTYETIGLTSNSWNSNNLNVANSSKPNNSSNTFIIPGHTYYISNYRMKLGGSGATITDWRESEMFLPLGGGDSASNQPISHTQVVIPPPTLANLSSTYNSYLTSAALFAPSPTDTHVGSNYEPSNTLGYNIYQQGSSSVFGNVVSFFADDSSYNFTSTTRKCINNKNNYTLGYNLSDGSNNRIGQKLGIWDSSGSYIDPETNTPINGLTKFELKEDAKSTATTTYSEGWYDAAGSDQGNTATDGNLVVSRSPSIDAYSATTSGVQYDRLHGWYLGIDASANVTNVNLTNYPDIATDNSYNPYNFNLKQYINLTTASTTGGTQVGQTSEYDLFISKYSDKDISWNPNAFTPVTIPTTPQFFGLELPSNSSDIANNNFALTGTLTQIDTRWRTSSNSGYLFKGTTYYFKTSTSDPVSSEYNLSWTSSWSSSASVNNTFTVSRTQLTNSTRNYSRDNTQDPQFGVEGTFSNNVGRLLQTQSYPNSGPPNGPYTSFDFTLSGNSLLWWDYTWGAGTPWNGTTGIQNKSGFFNISNNGSNVPYMLIPVDAGVNAYNSTAPNNVLPHNTTSADPSSNFTIYNHTQDISYNQAMWCKDSYKAYSAATSATNPYINYSTTYHQQTNDYTFSGNPGDDLDISYLSQNFWDPDASANLSQYYTNIKWLTFKIKNNGSKPNIKYKIFNGSTALTLGTDFILFVKEEQAANVYNGTTTNFQWQRNGQPLNFSPWMDAANQNNPGGPGSCNPGLGKPSNGIYITGGTTSSNEYKLKALSANTSSNTWQFFKLGLIGGNNVSQIQFTYET